MINLEIKWITRRKGSIKADEVNSLSEIRRLRIALVKVQGKD